MEFVIITGASGAGKSKAASFMEDMHFFCVDNLPAPLIPKFAELGMAGVGEYDRVALVTDIRSGPRFEELFTALDQLKEMKCPCRILYMEADPKVIIRRYKESRRSHPLENTAGSLEAAIAEEREKLRPLRERADDILDTTNLSTAKLKGELRRLFGRPGGADGKMEIKVVSFGFKHGIPMDSDLVMDVRFLPNPFYVPELRHQTGLSSGVRDYVFSTPASEDFMERFSSLLLWLLPQYEEEGKTGLVISIGCTGGHHRSVAVAHAAADALREAGWPVQESHRDLGRS